MFVRLFIQHVSRCLIAGIVALLPLAGLVLTIAYLEHTLAASGLAATRFYFPGLGLLLAAVMLYLIGLIVSTVLGRWMWMRVDRLFTRLPLLGRLYQTLKQILGYGDAEEALFLRVVLVRNLSGEGAEIAFHTNDERDADGRPCAVVFVPGVPNPMAGRLLRVAPESLVTMPVSVNEAMKTLVSLGKIPLVR